ncbi:hypothetical protein OV203_14740 [Nannocystis sp. ILAH1]|uniref:hypothetical protein n=1 Tax=unclassified Nannocystis TaxID=2627009 RepID=UPI002270A6FD|nr:MULTISPECIES: hypothetical protein [unclassified Nannocystis]MCY0988387.1 hypothetical protein [Nannocystis sp. ILAH1]MCY1067652.1 hypothetical protein [Nannocystis sp. RBIL2]
MASSRLLIVVALLAQVVALGACQRKIGSACRVSTDCSFRGERICDLSYLIDSNGNPDSNGKGECTIEGCTPGSCPKEGACIQVFNTEFLSVACDPDCEDRRPVGPDDKLSPDDPQYKCRELDDPTIYNRCTDQELCLPEGLCADLLSARISCRKECNSDRGCRDGYECRETGSNGVYVAFSPTNPESLPIEKICMPVEPKAGE